LGLIVLLLIANERYPAISSSFSSSWASYGHPICCSTVWASLLLPLSFELLFVDKLRSLSQLHHPLSYRLIFLETRFNFLIALTNVFTAPINRHSPPKPLRGQGVEAQPDSGA
jgi:hypothetical protein